jgi:hypothetical protein
VSGGRRCPACGEPLYGWVVVGGEGGRGHEPERVLDRCEACGLGIAHETDQVPLEAGEGGPISVPNRRSWQAGLGGSHWAPLRLEPRGFYPTPEALARLLDRAGLEAQRLRQPALGTNQLWMWQTLMNALTFHDGFAVRVLGGRLGLPDARSRVTFALDLVVSLVAALPVAVVSLPLELLAVAMRRGGLIEAEVRKPRA